jgi:hypothetical protein
LQKEILRHISPWLLSGNSQEVIAKAISLWHCGYSSRGSGDKIEGWEWKKRKGGQWGEFNQTWKEFADA